MGKKVAVITWDAQTVKFYAAQMEAIFGDFVEIKTYNVQDGSAQKICKADLYLVSTCAFEGYEDVREYLPLGGEIVITQVTITKESLHRLLAVPRGTRALMVNINPRMVTETMAFLNQIGVNNIDFFPYYPGMDPVQEVALAVTPGESRYVPEGIRETIDIGARVLSADTLVEVALKLRCEQLLQREPFRGYIHSIVDNRYSFQRLVSRSIRLESLFEILQGILDMGVIGIDDEGVVFTFNQMAEYVIGSKRKDVLDRKAAEVLPFIPFRECFEARKVIKSRLVKVGEVALDVTVTPIIRRGSLVGGFAVVQRFTDEEYKQHKLRVQLMNKGHRTKYTFADIIGESPAIRKECDVAKKMAQSNASVLITGESGTGKELFAHAIHAASARRDYPFVAINCAAIPDSLLESELFGYEEGAFTGAKKGGKLGFFEFAHKGTLFLDEIEGMSQLLQMKLLRVIQEKEVLRVGGNKVISVDVRVIAATNENLREMVKRGDFRKDLFYRLGVLPIQLPPLRERDGDVFVLFEEMKRQIGGTFVLSAKTREVLLHHHWDGNIRELRNCVEYLAYVNRAVIEPEDLPPGIWGGDIPAPAQKPADSALLQALNQTAGKAIASYWFVLKQLYEAGENGRACGRQSLAQAARQAGLLLSEQEIRTILSRLEKLGLVEIYRGRGGSRLSKMGVKMVQ